jgi:hypothetical protein
LGTSDVLEKKPFQDFSSWDFPEKKKMKVFQNYVLGTLFKNIPSDLKSA